MYTLGAGRILIKSIFIVCLLNLLALKACWAHRTGENGRKKDNDEIKKKSVQTSSACGWTANSVVGGGIWLQLEVIHAFMCVPFICKNKDDAVKNEESRVTTTFLP